MDTSDARLGHLRLKHLFLLELIGELESISKAAVRLNLTQPAVSVMLKELEAVFHAELVARTRSGAQLTPAGMLTRDRLRIVLNELRATRSANFAAAEGLRLRVGVVPIAMVDLVPRAAARMRGRPRALNLEFFDGTVPGLIDDLVENRLDCAISRLDAVVHTAHSIRQLAYTPLLSMSLAVACAPRHPLASKKKVTLQALARENWVLVPKGSQTRNAFEQAFIQHGIEPPIPVMESLSFFANFHLVAETDLVTLAPSMAIERYAALRVVRRLRYAWPTPISPLLFICRKEKSRLAPLRYLKETLTAVARDMADADIDSESGSMQ